MYRYLSVAKFVNGVKSNIVHLVHNKHIQVILIIKPTRWTNFSNLF